MRNSRKVVLASLMACLLWSTALPGVVLAEKIVIPEDTVVYAVVPREVTSKKNDTNAVDDHVAPHPGADHVAGVGVFLLRRHFPRHHRIDDGVFGDDDFFGQHGSGQRRAPKQTGHEAGQYDLA